MSVDPDALREEALGAVAAAETEPDLDEVRVRYLGKKGVLTGVLRQLGSLTPEERGRVGKAANILKRDLQAAIGDRQEQLAGAALVDAPEIDVTLPGREWPVGRRHVLTGITEEIREIFGGMGFSVALGPDVEDDVHNFTALNIPEGHPAREMHDTFFVDDHVVLRTHTSPVQIRVMETTAPPVRMIFPGRVYRNEAIDATHGAEFHQCEVLYVDSGVTFRDLKGCLRTFCSRFFGRELRMRFRPSYFPFTEPSAELDIWWDAGKRSGWVEVLGCGMVHPHVLEHVGYDPDAVSGYAAGIGIERMAMLRYDIPDLRLFLENDLRFLAQF
jgi:phenylalanyl-tRNA synthetase alpha chain